MDRLTDLVSPLTMLRLWRGLWRRDARMAINRTDWEDIHRGGGVGSKFLRV